MMVTVLFLNGISKRVKCEKLMSDEAFIMLVFSYNLKGKIKFT